MDNSITLTLAMPDAKDEDCESILVEQTELLVMTWRDVLARYKAKGLAIPGLSFKRGKASVQPTSDTEYKSFAKTLLDHHLKYMPNDSVPAQLKAIKVLYATGKETEELIEFYNNSRESYKLTSWHTVRFKLGKVTEEKEDNWRKELSEEEKANVIKRLKGEISE